MSNAPEQSQAFLDSSQTAKRCGVARVTVHRTRREGRPPGSLGFKLGGKLLFDPAEVDAWIASKKAERRLDPDTAAAIADGSEYRTTWAGESV